MQDKACPFFFCRVISPLSTTRIIVAVMGGGFSGLMTAMHLARSGSVSREADRRPPISPRRRLFQPKSQYLLNVRAANMSAWPDDPAHFARWLAARHPGNAPGFAHRENTAHLQDLLAQAASREGVFPRLGRGGQVGAGSADGVFGCASGAVERVDAVVSVTSILHHAGGINRRHDVTRATADRGAFRPGPTKAAANLSC